MSETKFTEKEFNEAVEALNTYLKGKEKEEIKVEGTIEEQIKIFLAPILEAVENNEAGELPAEVIEFYNNYLAEDDEPETTEAAPEEKKTASKKGKKSAKPKKEKKPKAPPREKDAFGCTVGSGANKINELIKDGKGMKMNDIIQEVGTTRSRVQSHFASLKKKGFFIDNVDGLFYLLTEEPPERPKPEKKKPAPKKDKTEKKPSGKKTVKKTAKKKSAPKKEDEKTDGKKE